MLAAVNALRVVIIDDNPVFLEIVANILKRSDIVHTDKFSQSKEALAHLLCHPATDILILDLNMPDMDGIEMLRNLGSLGFSGGVLLFSGEENRILKTAARLASAYGLHVLGTLSKPVPASQLREYLQSYRPRQNNEQMAPRIDISADELRNAIEQRQIVPYFQPKVLFKNNSLVAAEVLARWFHPDKGLIFPNSFISLAEDSGLINELTWLLYEQAFACLQQWRISHPDFKLGLNLSTESLAMIDFPERLEKLARTYDLPCQAIELEITESRLTQNLSTALDVLSRLCLKGFHLSIDDFGTGYSSMSQLSLFPFTELKIDRSFVHNSSADPAAFAILETSATLAKKLDLVVVAEGIENETDWIYARNAGCDLAQGYFIAEPMSASAFAEWKGAVRYSG